MISYRAARQSNDLIKTARQRLTFEWWERSLERFDCYVPHVVINEIGRGDPSAAKERLQLVEGYPSLKPIPETKVLMERLLKGAVPKKAEVDALHIALAAVHNIDYLISWNCKHIANAMIWRQVQKIVEDLGYRCPVICTPDEMLEKDNDIDA